MIEHHVRTGFYSSTDIFNLVQYNLTSIDAANRQGVFFANFEYSDRTKRFRSVNFRGDFWNGYPINRVADGAIDHGKSWID